MQRFTMYIIDISVYISEKVFQRLNFFTSYILQKLFFSKVKSYIFKIFEKKGQKAMTISWKKQELKNVAFWSEGFLRYKNGYVLLNHGSKTRIGFK